VRNCDVFVNVAGGIAIQDPAIDLGIAVAIASSVNETPIPESVSFVGELGLTGEIRRVGYLDQRISEATRLGFGRIYIPRAEQAPSQKNVTVAERLITVLNSLFTMRHDG